MTKKEFNKLLEELKNEDMCTVKRRAEILEELEKKVDKVWRFICDYADADFKLYKEKEENKKKKAKEYRKKSKEKKDILNKLSKLPISKLRELLEEAQ